MKAKTAKIWARRVAEWRASGQTSTEFSAGREFSAGGLRHWACRLRKAAAATVPATLVARRSMRRPVAPRQVVRLARVVARPAGLAKEPEKRARDQGPLAEHGVGRGGIADGLLPFLQAVSVTFGFAANDGICILAPP